MTQPTKTRTQFADEYQVTPRTFRNWLKRANIKLPKGHITPKYQKVIYDTFGKPTNE